MLTKKREFTNGKSSFRSNWLFFCLLIIHALPKISTAQYNTAYGGGTNGNGLANSSFGYNPGHSNTSSASYNAMFGYFTGYYNSSGSYNSFFGSNSGNQNTTGGSNSFFGDKSGYFNTTGNYNSFVGNMSGQGNYTGSMNSFFGSQSGIYNQSGSYNTAVGYYALAMNASGSNNTIIGTQAGVYNKGSNNVFLGYQAGYNETGSNKLYISNSAVTTPLVFGDFSTRQLGINALINGAHTLNVGGTINSTGVYVNGVLISGDAYWTKAGNNVTTMSVIGVGTTLANNPNGYMFAINGKIGAKEVQIENTSTTWPDYVFKSNYRLMSLSEVESFIKDHGHLPEVPSEEQVKTEGIKVYEINVKLLQKIEELTLYLIESNKKIENLESEVSMMKRKD